MRLTGVKTLLKASPAVLALFVVAMASPPVQPVQLATQHPLNCPPPGYNSSAFPNMLQNAYFHAQDGDTSFTGTGYGGKSVAQPWAVFNHTHGTTRTSRGQYSLLTPKMLWVGATAARNGILQNIGASLKTGPAKVFASVDVLVLTGKVCIGTGNGPNTACDATSTTTNTVETLKACNGSSPATVLTIYSVGGPASFMLVSARVSKVE